MTATPMRGMVRLPLTDLRTHPANVREDVGDVAELAASIIQHGLLQPITVEDHGDFYLLVAGHRRAAAARRIGWTDIPAIVRPATTRDNQVALMVVENLQREDLNPIEKANAIAALRGMGHTQAQVARMVGKSNAWVATIEALLELTDAEREQVAAREVSYAVAYEGVKKRRTAARGGKQLDRAWAPPYFAGSHQLAKKAEHLCDGRNHNKHGRVGGIACGSCWERVIRDDERVAFAAEADLDEQAAS